MLLRAANLLVIGRAFGCLMLATALVAHSQEIQPSTSDERAITSTDSPAKSTEVDSAAAALRGETETERTFWLRRRAFVESVFEQSAFDLTDSSAFFRFAVTAGQLGLDQKELSKSSRQTDYIGDRLRAQQSGSSAQFNVGNLIGQGLKYLAGKVGMTNSVLSPWTIMPSETEVRVMNVLWRSSAATSAEIYAQLDSAKLNYKEVNTVLENMVGRGLVERTQVSPKNEFTVLGTFAIEMSGLNAKNREYTYRPRASRDLMVAYLDASAFSQRRLHTLAENMLHEHLRKLLALIAQENGEL